MKTCLSFLIITVFASCLTHAQYEGSSSTAAGRGVATTMTSDYQCLGINPANLGWGMKFEGKRFAVGFMELGTSLYSESLGRSEVRREFRNILGGKSPKFSLEEKRQAAKDFSNSGIAYNMDIGWAGAAIMTDALGGIGFRINEKMQFYSKFGSTASELLFLGYNAPMFDSLLYIDGVDTAMIANADNISKDSLDKVVSGVTNFPKSFSSLLDGTEISGSWTREYNLSYGRKIIDLDNFIALYGGVGIKYVQGFGIVSISSSGSDFSCFSAISPVFNIEYGKGSQNNPSLTTQEGTSIPEPVGHGVGFDVGANAVLFNKLKIGLAITDIGSITWNGNVFIANDTLLSEISTGGIDNLNPSDQVSSLLSKNSPLRLTVSLPTAVRLGASMEIGDLLDVGIDIVLPANDVPGSYEKALVGIGGDFKPLSWLRFSMGFTSGGNYPTQMPMGIGLQLANGTWEIGIASRDASSYFKEDGSTLSMSTGFLRFRL